MKDWNGNKASVRANLGVVQKGNVADRQSEDFYATEPAAIELLLQHYTLPYCISIYHYDRKTQVISIPKEKITLNVAVEVENYLKRCRSIYYYSPIYSKSYYLYRVIFSEWKPRKVQSFMQRLDKYIYRRSVRNVTKHIIYQRQTTL